MVLVASAHLARSEAIKRNADVTLCVSNSDGTDCGSGGWEQGWIVLAADGTVIQHQQALPAGLQVIHKEGAKPLVLGLPVSDTYSKFKVVPTYANR
jgi:type IV fimbrial biogenesis protein FimT